MSIRAPNESLLGHERERQLALGEWPSGSLPSTMPGSDGTWSGHVEDPICFLSWNTPAWSELGRRTIGDVTETRSRG